ncbi:RHS repeat-associated core domain-containing protein [Pirellulaceae bacterium SH501]
MLPDPDASGPLSRPTTTYAYDALGRRTSLTDPESNVTSWSYDSLGRVVSETDPLSEVTSFAYDAAGRLTERTDRRGLVTEFNYDDLDRMTSEVWKDGSSTVRTLSFSHDAVGNLLSASDPSASYDYTYDNLYRTTQTEVAYGTGVNSFRLTAAFDAASRRTSLGLEVDSGSGWGDDLLNSYSFDSLGRVTQITQAGQTGGATVQDKRVDFAYTVDGLFDSITRYKSLTGGSANEVARSEYTRDDLGRITSLEHLHDTTSIADYNFTYDAYSRITQVAATSLVGLAGTTDFTYDTTGQLTAADHTHISDEAYSYDENGNRLTKVRISSAPADDKTVETQWDHRNRLIGIVTKNNTGVVTKEVDYEYDVFNRRVSKSIDADGAGPASTEVTRFVYDGGDILAVTDASGDITHRMLHGSAVDQILAIEEDATGEVLWGLTDHLGSIRDIVDNDGNVENHIVYDAFGNVVSETDAAIAFLYGFTGRERDEESGLNYHRARYYDTATGRWLSNDPIGFAAGDTNIQRYVGNNPVNYVDPSGLVGEPIEVSISIDVDSGGMWDSSQGSSGSNYRGNWDLLDYSANFAAGWGDTLSFGATDCICDQLGINDGIDHESNTYYVGVGTGVVHSIAIGGAAGVTRAGTRGASKGILDRIGGANLPYRTPVTNQVKASRFFATRTGYQQVINHSPITKWAQSRGWQSHHWAIPRSTGRAGSEGLRRITEAGWNLIPLPARWNRAISNGGLGYNATRVLVGTSPVTVFGGGYALGSSVYETATWWWSGDDE